jgi:hypothetical protein
MDIDSDKVRAVLEQLEAEKAKRAAAKVASGEVVVIGGLFGTGYTEEEADSCLEAMKAAEVARLRAGGETRPVVFDEETCWAIVTGVPRATDSFSSSPGAPHTHAEEPASADLPLAQAEAVPAPQEPTYVRAQVRPGDDDGDEGEIAEGMFSVSRGSVTVTDIAGKPLGSRPLRAGEDAMAAARRLLRETAAKADFNRPIKYPKLGLA